MAGRKQEARATADISHSLSVKYVVFIKKIAHESVERHRIRSRFLKPGRRPLGIWWLQGVWINTIFTTCENAEFWNQEVEAILGHANSSIRSEQSTPEVVW
jgi:hypothetical protein